MSKKRRNNETPSPESLENASLQSENEQLIRKTKDQEKQIRLLNERIEKMNMSRWSIPLQKTKSKAQKKAHVRVIIPDTHGCFIDPEAASVFLEDLEALNAKCSVWIGDHIDCGGFLAQHHTWGYVAEADYTFEQDIDAANDFIDKVQSVVPGIQHHYLEGNHEARIEKWCVTSALRQKRDAAFLLKHFGTFNQLHLKKRGINFYKQGEKYMDLPVPATIRLGHCYFTHGSKNAKHSADKMLDAFGACVVFGHNHRSQEFSGATVKEGMIRAWCPGCLCRQQPLWKHTDPSNWNHGYGVQLVADSGDFLHLNIPIIDGKSFLVSLTDQLG